MRCDLGSIEVNESVNGIFTVRPEVFLDIDVPRVNTIGARAHGSRRDQDRANNETNIAFGYADGVPGNLLWSTSLPNRNALLHGQIIVGDALYFGVSRGIYAVSKSTGQLQWHYALEGRARALGLHNGTLIATDGNVYSLDPATGEVNWKYITGSDTQGVEWARIVRRNRIRQGIEQA